VLGVALHEVEIVVKPAALRNQCVKRAMSVDVFNGQLRMLACIPSSLNLVVEHDGKIICKNGRTCI
jgi:hypothetical protein